MNEIAERQLFEAIRVASKAQGWMLFHCYDSRRSIGAGFPDCVLVSPDRGRIIFAELKSDSGRMSALQSQWLDALAECGAETAVWRPSDVEEIARALL